MQVETNGRPHGSAWSCCATRRSDGGARKSHDGLTRWLQTDAGLESMSIMPKSRQCRPVVEDERSERSRSLSWRRSLAQHPSLVTLA